LRRGTVPGAVATGRQWPGRYRSRYRTGPLLPVHPIENCSMFSKVQPLTAETISSGKMTIRSWWSSPLAAGSRPSAWSGTD